jgi:prevent-host-death family protein
MSEVTVRELRNQGGKVLDRVLRGERITVTRDGKPVAELRPCVQARVSATRLLDHWRRLPPLDPTTLRDDLDRVLDARI